MSPNLTFLLVNIDAVSSEEEGDLPACHQHSIRFNSQHLWWCGQLACFGTMNAERFQGFRAAYVPLQTTSISGKALCISAGQWKNHILQLLQQHGFIGEESRCWTDPPAANHELFSSWKAISVNNGRKFQHSRNSLPRCLEKKKCPYFSGIWVVKKFPHCQI